MSHCMTVADTASTLHRGFGNQQQADIPVIRDLGACSSPVKRFAAAIPYVLQPGPQIRQDRRKRLTLASELKGVCEMNWHMETCNTT